MNRQTSSLLVAVLFGVVVGAVIASRLGHDEPSGIQLPAKSPDSILDQVSVDDSGEIEPDQLAEVLESLTNTLNEEISERRLLSQQLEALRAEVKELQTERRDNVSRANVVDLVAIEALLVEMGFTEQDQETIYRLVAANQVRQVELDDRARREGWRNTSRYNEEAAALFTFDNPIRDELGDDRFDRYMYAWGRPNRVVAGGIMPTSEAQKAGFHSGDVIVRYGGEPVYSNFHLVRLRSSGKAGEPVIVEINRNGQPMLLTIPRGPMGFGGSEENIDPRTNIRPLDEPPD